MGKFIVAEIYHLGIVAREAPCSCLWRGIRTPAKPGAGCCRDDGQAALDGVPCCFANRRNEQQQTENIREEARDDQQEGGDDDHHAMNQLAARIDATPSGFPDPLQNAQPLDAQQHRTDHTAEQDQEQCRPDTDFAPHKDESCDLRQGQGQKEQGDDQGTHGVRSVMGGVCKAPSIRAKK